MRGLFSPEKASNVVTVFLRAEAGVAFIAQGAICASPLPNATAKIQQKNRICKYVQRMRFFLLKIASLAQFILFEDRHIAVLDHVSGVHFVKAVFEETLRLIYSQVSAFFPA